jgi:hypothetical protein
VVLVVLVVLLLLLLLVLVLVLVLLHWVYVDSRKVAEEDLLWCDQVLPAAILVHACAHIQAAVWPRGDVYHSTISSRPAHTTKISLNVFVGERKLHVPGSLSASQLGLSLQTMLFLSQQCLLTAAHT